MDYKTTSFDVEVIDFNNYLEINKYADIDYFIDKRSQYIEWRATIIHSSQGISNIYGYVLNVNLNIRFRIDIDDLTDIEENNLINKFQCQLYNGFIEGEININTNTDKDWKLEFNIKATPSMIPEEIKVNFMDKYMEVI